MDNHPDKSDEQQEGWRARLRRWMKPPRRLSFTSSGKYFVLMTLGIGFGAVNTGNNLLFLLLGMMLSLIIASGVASEAVIRRLDAARRLPRRLSEGLPAPGVFSVHNGSRWPSLSIEVSERHVHGEIGPLAGQTLGPQRAPWWKFWKSTKRAESGPNAPIARAYTLRIEGEERLDVAARYTVAKRGLYRLEGLDIITRFPFGLFEKRRELDQPDELVVYPSPRSAADWVTTIHSRFGDIAQNQRGPGEEYFGLRDYRPGEDQRLIHWKSSARRGEVVVRETERQEQRAVEICVLNCTGRSASERHLVAPTFERGLGRVLSLVRELERRGYRVGLRSIDEAADASDASGHLDRMLTLLALIELRDGPPPAPLVGDDDPDVGRILVGLPEAVRQAGADFDLVLPFEGPTPRRDDVEEAA
jgi:uncharacterized protein (DUF58 family)